MKDLIATFEEKLEKHEGKLKAHQESERILRAEYEDLKKNNSEKQERVGEKLLSTVKNIEYHTAKYKTYKKVIEMLQEKLQQKIA